MKLSLFSFIISPLLFISSIHAQENIITELDSLYVQEAYDYIIENYSEKVDELPVEATYYIGRAYFMKEDDANCLKFMNIAISKEPKYPGSHYMKGVTFQFLEQPDSALISIQRAISLTDTVANYYTTLGDVYITLNQTDEALLAYQEATKRKNPQARAYTMIAEIQNANNQTKEALNTYYLAKEKTPPEDPSYHSVLFNIGLLEYLNENYQKAQEVFLDLTNSLPQDYHARAKLIQTYYALEDYEKANPHRDILYEAYHKGNLPENMKDMFCFDQFKWKGKRIQAFERFEEPEGELYYKHLFYVINEQNEVAYRIQTENSVMSMALGGPKYLLGMNKDGVHSTLGFGFTEDFSYEFLKKAVIQVVEEKADPVASSKSDKEE